MRFFKRFSFRHRRVKSDTAILPRVAPQVTLPVQSHSAEQLSTPAHPAYSGGYVGDILEAVVPRSNGISPLAFASAALQGDLLVARSRIQALEAEVEDLIATNKEWAREYNELQGRAETERVEALCTSAAAEREVMAAKAEVETLQTKLAHYERLLGMLLSTGLHELVLDNAQAAVRSGVSADEMLVDAIKVAASRPGSAWARIMPAIVGPRAPEQYVTAINMALRVRRELKESCKVTRFWKRAAKEDGRHADTVTPSPSNLSEIVQPLPAVRQRAVDDLLSRLRSGARCQMSDLLTEPRMCRRPVEELDVTPGGPHAHFEDVVGYLTRAPGYVEARAAQAVDEEMRTLTKRASTLSFGDCLADTLLDAPVYSLPPLASESFRLELASRASEERFFKLSTFMSSNKRASEDTIMTTLPSSCVLPKSESITSQVSRMSTKTLGKRRAMMVSQSLDSLAASIRTEEKERATPTSHDPFVESNPYVDLFTPSLLESFSKVRRKIPRHSSAVPRRQHADSHNSRPFDNSAFNPLLTSTPTSHDARKAVDIPGALVDDLYDDGDFHVLAPPASFETLDEFSELPYRNPPTMAMTPPPPPPPLLPPLPEVTFQRRPLVVIAEESEGSLNATLEPCSSSSSSSSAARTGHASDDDSQPTTLRDASFGSAPVTASTAPTTPQKEREEKSASSPAKTSRLPVLKQLRRMSISKPAGPGPGAATTPAVMMTNAANVVTGPSAKKKKKENMGVSAIPTAVKAPVKDKNGSAFGLRGVAGSRIATSGRKMVRRLSMMVSSA